MTGRTRACCDHRGACCESGQHRVPRKRLTHGHHEHGPPSAGADRAPRVIGPKLLLLFIVGDILGTGVYALTGQVAAEVGGAAWLPFLIAFAVALLTAFSYLELVTKYPQTAGAALYVHKAFGIHFVTFIVTFIVMCSGITSASTASRAFAANLGAGFGLELPNAAVMLIAMGFMLAVMAINFRGVSESVKTNVVLTLVELSGLVMVILIGFWAIAGGNADFSRVVMFETRRTRRCCSRCRPRRRWRSSRWSGSRTR